MRQSNFKFAGILLALLFILGNIVVSTAFALTEEESNKFARQAYEKALNLSRNSNSVDLASMYFVNALSFNPGRIDIITDYVSMIVRQVERGGVPSDTLDALDDFLGAQIMTVKPDDIQRIIKLKETVSKTQESLINRSTARESPRPSVDPGRESKKYQDQAARARNLKECLQALRNAQQALDEQGIEDADVSENLQAALALDAGIHQVEKMLSMSEEKRLEPLQMYYLQLAEASMQQFTALGLNLPRAVNEELLAMKKKVEAQIEKVSEVRSAVALEQINRDYDNLRRSINLMDTEQKKIDAINTFIQTITERAQQVTSPKAGGTLRNLMQAVQQQMMDCREEQEKRYNRWAIGKVKDVAVELRDEKNSSTICNIIIAHLSNIDTRYLNFGANNRFNSVYVEHYQKMDDGDKEVADIALASNDKRKLSEF